MQFIEKTPILYFSLKLLHHWMGFDLHFVKVFSCFLFAVFMLKMNLVLFENVLKNVNNMNLTDKCKLILIRNCILCDLKMQLWTIPLIMSSKSNILLGFFWGGDCKTCTTFHFWLWTMIQFIVLNIL